MLRCALRAAGGRENYDPRNTIFNLCISNFSTEGLFLEYLFQNASFIYLQNFPIKWPYEKINKRNCLPALGSKAAVFFEPCLWAPGQRVDQESADSRAVGGYVKLDKSSHRTFDDS